MEEIITQQNILHLLKSDLKILYASTHVIIKCANLTQNYHVWSSHVNYINEWSPALRHAPFNPKRGKGKKNRENKNKNKNKL